jgi:membrane-bound metal-dependent hydrolase YbcI (DUF457 family)
VNTPAHLSIGAAVTLGVCAAVSASPVFAAGAGLASLVGSRAPDWDIKLEKLRRGLARLWIIGRPLRGLHLRHRGPTHYLVSWAIMTALCGLGASLAWSTAMLPVVVGVGTGYLAHLLADGCTIRGVPYFGPWNKRCVNLFGPRVSRYMSHGGGDLCGMVAVLAAVGLAALLLAPMYDRM